MTAPTVRVDREWGEEAELFVVENFLRRYVAPVIRAKTLAGPIYGRILLPPELQERKRALMEGGQ